MSSGLISLNKILKDETRRQIVLLLNDKGNLSYTDLLNSLENISTGRLNYHLKVLDDLLSKEDGQYTLTEKGKLASKLITEFPEKENNFQKRKKFWIIAALSQIVFLAIVITVFYLGFIDFGRLVLYSVWFFGSIGLAYLGYRMQENRPASGSKEEKSRLRLGYVMLGGFCGLAFAFFGTTFLTIISISFGGPNFLRMVNKPQDFSFLVLCLTSAGAIIGYYLGKRNGFKKPRWAVWLDERYGF
jgi:DNA-binding transcriptional ArsR family regulator